ncbi:MAG: hypothetical protein RSB97_08210, partial [Christensenella sp.]
TNIQRIANSILDNDEDVRDDFTRTLEGGNWKDAFLKARTNDFKKGADAYVSDIFAGKAQPSDGLTGSAEPGDAFDYTDGELFSMTEFVRNKSVLQGGVFAEAKQP